MNIASSLRIIPRARRGRVVSTLAVLGILLSAVAAGAESIHARIEISAESVQLRTTGAGTRVAMHGAPVADEDTAPVLPMEERLFYVPEGFQVETVRVTPVSERTLAEGVTLARRSAGALAPDEGWNLPRGAVVAGSSVQPARSGVSLGGGNLGGFRVHTVALFPVRWESAGARLTVAEAFDIELDLVRASAEGTVVRERASPRGDEVFRKGLLSLVENPSDVPPAPVLRSQPTGPQGFAPEDLPSVDGSAVDMVIVTTDAMSSQFTALADWKTKKGVPCVVRSVEWIDANYPGGRERAERIRFFLRDAYGKWGTYLALLAGEPQFVPALVAWTQYAGGNEILTDQYFACLDGDWNADGDDRIGEGIFITNQGDSPDVFPELLVGRASVEDSSEAATFVSKSLTYDKSPPAGYVERHGGLGEVLFPSDWEFGVDPPESISTDGKGMLRDSLDTYLPSAWTRSLRYQSDNDESRAIALAELSAGNHILSVVGHGDAFEFSVGNGGSPLIQDADIAALTNGDKLMFFVGVSCNPNQVDLECQGERMMNNPNGGMIGVLASTRVDFPISAAEQTAGMFRAAFTHGLTGFGELSEFGRTQFAGVAASDINVDRWTWLTKMLLGDPELRIWTQEPAPLTVAHMASAPLGTSGLAVTVTDSGAQPVADALVCVSDGNGTYSRALTDAAGQAVLPITSTQTGTADVVVTAREFLPHEGVLTLTAPAGAHLAKTAHVVDDDAVGPSNGNGDGVVESGETIELNVTVLNGGAVTASSAALSGTIEGGGSATFDFLYGGVQDPTKVFIGPDRVSPGALPFTLDFGSPSIAYIGHPSLTFAPDTLAGVPVADAGIFVWQDHDGWHLQWGAPAESLTVSGTVTTDGRVRGSSSLLMETGDVRTVSVAGDSLTFSGTTHALDTTDGVDFTMSDSTVVTMTASSAALGNLAASAQANGTLVLDVASGARLGQVAYVDLSMTATVGGPWTGEIPIVFAGPELEAYRFAVQDSGGVLSGDGDGVIEVGETVRLTPTVINRGNGGAPGVSGSATTAGGITFVDAADSYGDVASLAETAGTDGYVFTVDDSTGTTIDLMLTDTQGRSWLKTMDFVAPLAADSAWFTSNSQTITVAWTPSDSVASPDVAGYNVYRSATPGSGHVKQNFEIIRSGAKFIDAAVSLGTTYYYLVAAVDSSGNEGPPTTEVAAWTTQVQVGGWPQRTSHFNYPGLLMTDSDNDRMAEIYTGCHDANLYAWDEAGNDRPGFPMGTAFEIWGAASAADMDQDGDDEIFFGGRDTRVYAIHHDATPLYGSNTYVADLPGASEEIRSAVTISDVDADGRLEFLLGTDLGTLYAFNHDGTGLTDSTGLLFTAPPGDLSARIWGTIAVADLDNNGSKEIAFASWNDSLYVIDATGTVQPGFPRAATNDFRGGVVAGDLDNDGTLEILAGNFDGNVYAFNHDGTDYLSGGILATLPDKIGAGIALANLDADPELEILVGCFDAKLYAYNHDGSSFLAGQAGVFADLPPGSGLNDGISATPIVVDVDGDGDFEIFVGHRNDNFYGFHHDGSTVIGMPIPTADVIFATAAAGDLDDDGDVDIAFSSYDATVNVLDFGGASTADAYEWPTYGGNNGRTATYGDRGPATAAPTVGPGEQLVFTLEPNSPNPFLGATTIRYAVTRDQRVTLNVYNIAGRLVRSLVNGQVSAGRNVVRWDGRDGQGRRLSSGVYFFRLQNGEQRLTRKAVLLR